MRTSKLKYRIRSFFTYNRSEQKGILLLVSLIIIVTAINLSLPYLIKSAAYDYSEFDSAIRAFTEDQQELKDSILIRDLQNRGKIDSANAEILIKPFTFDPNKISDREWQELGLSHKQVQSILNYLAKGGHFKQKSDLKKMYCISEWEYKILEPYILIEKDTKSYSNNQIVRTGNKTKVRERVAINLCDSSELQRKLGLPSWLAQRVIKYRKLLGGYCRANQLYEVYGFDSSRYQAMLAYIDVDSSIISRLDINHASFTELNRHPYISYELTKFIVSTREVEGNFLSVEEMMLKAALNEQSALRLKSYLVAGP